MGRIEGGGGDGGEPAGAYQAGYIVRPYGWPACGQS
jgi:hypothetical protein